MGWQPRKEPEEADAPPDVAPKSTAEEDCVIVSGDCVQQKQPRQHQQQRVPLSCLNISKEPQAVAPPAAKAEVSQEGARLAPEAAGRSKEAACGAADKAEAEAATGPSSGCIVVSSGAPNNQPDKTSAAVLGS